MIDDDLMEDGRRFGREGWRRTALVAAGCLILAVLDFSRLMIVPPYREHWWVIVIWRFPLWMLWILFVPGIRALSRRLPVERPRRIRAGVAHLAYALLILVTHSVASGALMTLAVAVETDPNNTMGFAQSVVIGFILEGPVVLMLYAALLSLFQGIRYYRRSQRQELAASRLEARLAQARLDNLRMQLHPHFLFNALNAVATLVRRGTREQAIEVLAGLGDLLRQALEKSSQPWVTLRDELRLVGKYLALEEVRFQDRLRVEQTIDPKAEEALVPTLILQPLVENAVRHGVAARRSAGCIQIQARVKNGDGDDSRLILEVLDDGPGPDPEGRAPEDGVGLTNTRARLAEIFGDEARLRLESREGGGAVSRVEFPLRRPQEGGGS